MEVIIEKKCEEHFILLQKYFDVYFDLEKFLTKDKYMSFCLRIDGILCGVSLVHSIITPKGKNILKIIYTVIDENHRGSGYNILLLNSIHDYSTKNNIKYIIANIRESNKPSVKSFFKNGYRISNVLTEPYKNKEKKIRVVRFVTQSEEPILKENEEPILKEKPQSNKRLRSFLLSTFFKIKF